MTTSTQTEQTVKSSDGIDLAVYKWSTENKPKAQLLISHGLLEHGQRYREFGQTLAEKHQITVYAYDYRGHGKSGGRRVHVDKWEQYHEDIDAVLAIMDKDIPKFVLGHSNGGLVTIGYFEKKIAGETTDVKGLLLCSPFLKEADELPYLKVLATRLLGSIVPKLHIPVSEDDISGKTLTRDEQKIAEHDSDERMENKLTVGYGKKALTEQKRVRDTVKQLHVPVMFAYAGSDQVACPRTNKRYGQLLAADDKTILERKGDFHEILNEKDRFELYDIFAEWILKRA